ncbi:MAG: extracellular solute-binding protein [Anaerolineae bacterium]|nr:extracellular solute-binding protein [Anaerolineae bacterium]HRX03917.1 extracellular solute-binding protein [Anaerolineae bacterium]
MRHRLFSLIALMLIASVLLAACGGAAEPTAAPAAVEPTAAPEAVAEPTAAPAPAASGSMTKLGLWTHSAGNEGEMEVITKMADDFNASQDQFEVVIEAFPQASYNDSVAAASVAGSLPCIIDLDQPTVPNFAWSGYVQELPVPADMLAGINTGGVGLYNDKVYSMGQFDVALLNYARKSVLEKYDIRIPTLDEPWTLDEFNTILKTLKDSGEFDYAMDVNAEWTGEWWPYAYSPMLQSFGGDLIDRATFTTAEGVLNGPEAQAWGEWFQGLFADGYVNPAPADDQCFLQGHCALWYTGSWSANDVVAALGDDALFLPAVDFGNGPKIGGGSWQWGISTACENPDGAWQFIESVMKPENVALMSNTTGLVPTTAAGAALTEKYAEGGPYQIFYDMSNRYTVMRPPTPGYLRLSSEFEQAAIKIRDGNNVQDTLDDAVDAINQDIQDNNNYGF